MNTIVRNLLLSVSILLFAACGSGPVRRVSEPATSVQQLSVNADGSWSVDMRVHNYSSVAMQLDRLDVTLTIAGQPAGTLQDAPGVRIGPESADVVTIAHVPPATARMALADALAGNRSVDYQLGGTLQATPESGNLRQFPVKRDSRLSPVPGLAGVLR